MLWRLFFAFILLLVAVGAIFKFETSNFSGANLLWHAYAENKEAIGPLLTPVAALIAALIAFGQFAVARQRHEAQTKADFQRRITDTYSKAIEHLSNDQIVIRLGGIFLLERISLESDQHYRAAMQTLVTFLKERIGWRGETELDEASMNQGWRSLPTDVSAILDVIGRRATRGRWASFSVDLSALDLRRVLFIGANLRGIDFTRSHLEGANFQQADLRGAHFFRANLDSANFTRAKAQRAYFGGAQLTSANFWEGSFVNAVFVNANLERAHLEYARLRNADFLEANLQNSTLHFADMKSVLLSGANLGGANLYSSRRLSAKSLSQALGNESTVLPPKVKRPAGWPKSTMGDENW
jgi:uncharacterized protein YjbI with pentapeptide repeats